MQQVQTKTPQPSVHKHIKSEAHKDVFTPYTVTLPKGSIFVLENGTTVDGNARADLAVGPGGNICYAGKNNEALNSCIKLPEVINFHRAYTVQLGRAWSPADTQEVADPLASYKAMTTSQQRVISHIAVEDFKAHSPLYGPIFWIFWCAVVGLMVIAAFSLGQEHGAKSNYSEGYDHGWDDALREDEEDGEWSGEEEEEETNDTKVAEGAD